jgi:hypothetical protein
MDRMDVFRLIDEERQYQSKWPAEFDDANTPNDWVAYIAMHLGKAVTMPWNRETFRKSMVKVAALAVCALEREHYAPRHYDGWEQQSGEPKHVK